MAAGKAAAGSVGGEEEQDAAAAAGAARGRVVGALMRKHLAAHVVPVAIQLKRLLEEARHSLLGDLMSTLAALLADHKHEVCRVSGGPSPCCPAAVGRSIAHTSSQPRLLRSCTKKLFHTARFTN